MPSPNSNIARRPGLMFACVNLGIPVALAWQFFENGAPRGIFVVGGLVSLVVLNGLVMFMYRRAKAVKPDQ
jgi:hypothetical protein